MSDLGTMLKFVHRENIGRYQKILRTYLTANERRFVECRLAEEEAALQKIIESDTSIDTSIYERPQAA